MKTWLAMMAVTLTVVGGARGGPPTVRTMRVPDGGIQPQVVARGTSVHLVYFTGDAKAGDVWYARSADGGRTFAAALRVNSEPGSAIAAGTVRGPRLAVGRGDRAHVAWMGSKNATPKAPSGNAPMLYARLNDAGDAFEPQRNVIADHPGLDGGGTVAADVAGNVYVVWHAPQRVGDHDEQARTVWAARSVDEGKTFQPEVRVVAANTGVCACCGIDALADAAGVHVLYRTAHERVHRDVVLARFDPRTARRQATPMGRLNIGICVMSTASIVQSRGLFLAAWEGHGEVFCGRAGATDAPPLPHPPPGNGKNRKHPRLAVNEHRQTLMVWTEGTAWNKGGSIRWQVFDEDMRPIQSGSGRAEALPVWGTAAVFATDDGGFSIVY